MSSLSSPIANLLSQTTALQQAVSSPAGIIALVTTEASALTGATVSSTDLYPLQCLGQAEHLVLAGVPNVELAFHKPLEQGRMLESSLGEANAFLMHKMLDLDEKIGHYLSLNTLAIDGQLSDVPRAVKFAKDSLTFIQQIRLYVAQGLALAAALQANLRMLQAMESRMVGLIDTNLTSLNNLLNEICNWALPSLPSLAAQLAGGWHWNGFRFNLPSGFQFNAALTAPNLNFSFNACKPLVADFSSLFNGTPSSIPDSTLTVSTGTLALPTTDGAYGDPARYSSAPYIATMQATTTPVYDPTTLAASNGTSLPTPASIISDYSLTAATYTSNVISAVAVLAPIVIQPGDADYTTGASASRRAALRSLCVRFVTLGQIVASNFDPNLTAAWILYMGLNRTGRAGYWIANLQAAYADEITPSLTYLHSTPVPWNKVLGGNGVSDAPAAIPLLARMKATGAANLLWRLSYLEAALLGYPRNPTWDSAADATFLSGYTGGDLDFVPTAISAAPTSTVTLGVDTAAYPVACTYPQSIAGALATVITSATAHIAATPTYQSSRPQFRFVYDLFAQASLVDRFTQFWREFNANLVALLAEDAYLVSFVVTYPEALSSAIDPLGDPTLFASLQLDAAARNRNWTPGIDLLPVPTATTLATAATPVSTVGSGWTGTSLDPAAFLARPDIQSLPLPTQVAMLRTSQSISTLLAAKTTLQTAVATATATAQASIAGSGLPGWSVDSSIPIPVPPGSSGQVVPFSIIDFNQTGYVSTPSLIVIPTAGTYILAAAMSWDPNGAAGTRTAVLIRNGAVLAEASATSASDTPFTVQLSTQAALVAGDRMQVVASHDLDSSQLLESGSSFLGLLTP